MKKPIATDPVSTLPAEIEGLIAQVVKRARLRRGERGDVERELRSHFLEGLAEGKSAPGLMQEFGDAKGAARMIGRAKRRCRGVVWQAWVWSVRGVAALFALVVVTYAWAAWAYYGAEPTITRNYLKELNDPIRAFDPAECALPEYEAVYYSFTQKEVEGMRRALGAQPGESFFADQAEVMNALRPHFDRIRAAADRPYLGFVLTNDSRTAYHVPAFDLSRTEEFREHEAESALGDVLLRPESLMWLFHPALLLHLERAIADCDAETVLADAKAMVGMSRQTNQIGFVITHGNATARAMSLLQTIRNNGMRSSDCFSSEQLRRLAHILDAAEMLETLSLQMDLDASMDFIQRSFTPGPMGMAILNGAAFDSWRFTHKLRRLKPGEVLSGTEDEMDRSVWDPGVALVSATRSEAERFTEELFRCIERDTRSKPWEVDQLQSGVFIDGFRDGRVASARLWFSRDMALDARQAIVGTWRFGIELDATLAVIAAECFRREHSRWPRTWDELVPSYLPEVPVDMFDGKPLRMAERDGQWFIYSIGVDRKDDGGRMPVNADGAFQPEMAAEWKSRASFGGMSAEDRMAREGDWILWPMVDEETGEFVVGAKSP